MEVISVVRKLQSSYGKRRISPLWEYGYFVDFSCENIVSIFFVGEFEFSCELKFHQLTRALSASH